MLKRVNYVIRPSTAMPAKIQRLANGEVYDFDLDQVELAALRETLQTTFGANPFSSFIRGFLATYSEWLIWLGEGPGIGREMRRVFSGMFGRFFARAYLSDCHGFVWFAPLDGPRQDVAPRLRVRSGGPRQDLPDWICAGAGHLALAESKGARSNSRLTYHSRPAPIRQAIKQLESCRVSVFNRARWGWVDRKVKGWAVLNRWRFQLSNTGPFLFVVDPDTGGDLLPYDDLPGLVRAVAREHVGGLLRGLMLFTLSSSLSYAGSSPYAEAMSLLSHDAVFPTAVSVPALAGVLATGRLFSLSPGDLSTRMFGEEIFIGVQDEVIENLLRDSDTAPMLVEPQSLSSEGVIRGADGLIVARQSAVTILR
jgi:hypothetical protein